MPGTHTPHQEGWRDWPIEAPATTSDLGPRGGANSSRSRQKAWKMWGNVRPDLPTKWRRFFCFREKRGSDVTRGLEVQGVRGLLRAGRPLLLRALLRAARGRLRPLGP